MGKAAWHEPTHQSCECLSGPRLGQDAPGVLALAMAVSSEDLLKIGLAILVGGLVGAEREYRDKSAGFRTMIFICLGACLFTMHSIAIGITRDQARIAAAIVSGVGFLGGGAIMRGGMNIKGLTTAATIWLTAALGMGIGSGYYGRTLPAAGAVLVVLWLFPFIERWIDNLKTSRLYKLVYDLKDDSSKEVEAIFEQAGLRMHSHTREKIDGKLSCSWYVTGSPEAHRQAVDKVLVLANVESLRY
jgi:putative Mg2+ transporter-C (MgtC) family protein